MKKYDSGIIRWLLDGDVSIQWQTRRDLLRQRENSWHSSRNKISCEGWGAMLLMQQELSGQWGGGIYSPKWISTTYTMLLLMRLGLMPGNPRALKACELLMETGYYRDSGINYFKSIDHSETCVTGMILALLSYFKYMDDRLGEIVNYLLDQQMADGGWNCHSYYGARHSSFHTTINVLEGLREYEKTYPGNSTAAAKAQNKGREFLLMHRLFKSDRTGEIVKSSMTRFSFPPRWYYDVLRALDHFQDAGAGKDERLSDAIALLLKKRGADGIWPLQNRHSGKTFFEMEKAGKASRWNTLRALRVINWWNDE